jgi:hypothetical protein
MNTQQRGQGAVSTQENGVEARTRSPQELSVNKDWKDRRADSGLVISLIPKGMRHRLL